MNNFSSGESSTFLLRMAFDVNSEHRFQKSETLITLRARFSYACNICVTEIYLYDVLRASEKKRVLADTK